MGEAKKRAKHAIVKRMEPMIVDTPGGRIHVQWDSDSSATPNGQLTFFAEFLHTSGIYDAWVQDCPLHYTSPNAPTKRTNSQDNRRQSGTDHGFLFCVEFNVYINRGLSPLFAHFSCPHFSH